MDEMSLRSEMLRWASAGGRVLGDHARRMGRYVRGLLNSDGGFRGRGSRSDLYYTVFGLSILVALDEPLPAREIAEYLRRFHDSGDLDLTHLGCLARCWAVLRTAAATGLLPEAALDDAARAALARKVEAWRSADGAFAQDAGEKHGTVPGCFLAVGACEDLSVSCGDTQAIARCVRSCQAEGGGLAIVPGEPIGSVPATAASVRVLFTLGQPLEAAWGRWLREQCFQGGGFVVHPICPEPDLLSTAVALHALEALGQSLGDDDRRRCLGFVRGLRTEEGGFRGHADPEPSDCEYTFYGLLALGHLGGAHAD